MVNEILLKDRKAAAKIINHYVAEHGINLEDEVSKARVEEILRDEGFKAQYSWFEISDMSYNRVNKGTIADFPTDIHLFVRTGKKDKYVIVGEKYQYTGPVLFYNSETRNDEVKGEWIEGELTWFKGKALSLEAYSKHKEECVRREQEKREKLEEEAIKVVSIVESSEIIGEEKQVLAKTRINQSVFRQLLEERYKKCCLCGVSDKRFLIASHIKPWADASPAERVDVDNGLLLCPNHDKLFDKGLISFDSDGNIMISKDLSNTDKIFLNVAETMKINVTEGMKKYLEYHRAQCYVNNETL